jgi:hypothetical protein
MSLLEAAVSGTVGRKLGEHGFRELVEVNALLGHQAP